MREQIGKIILDLSKYPGEDFYCDGTVEDELLQIVQTCPEEEYAKVIEERKDWAVLYHLSHLRENIVDWIPMTKEMKVLEVGSGCGAITGALARKAGSVTCVDLSKKRSSINAYRHRDCDNVCIHVGNFKDIEPDLDTDYDCICLIGVFEYGQGYIGGQTPYEDFLRILKKHVKKDGRIIIAIENKYGLKYFAGCREDHIGTFFGGIENYTQGGGVRTFSRNGLEKIFRSCGVEDYHFYYPYPDYKFMTSVYSDEYQPGRGELSNNIRNFDRDRILLFDEKEAFDGLLEDDLFSVFSNSYLVVLGPEFPVKFAKYSNDRAPKYRIRTEILREEGAWKVYKYPMSAAAEGHVRGMEQAYRKLAERYAGSRLEVNHCTLEEGPEGIRARFEYIEGTSLEEIMDACLAQKDTDGFYRYFEEYLQAISCGDRVGGEDAAESDSVSDWDMIFSNIMVKDDKWVVIDYEWTFDRYIPAKELAYRAVYCYLMEDGKRSLLDKERMLGCLGMSEADAESFVEKELAFHREVNGEHSTIREMHASFGESVVLPEERSYSNKGALRRSAVQIYTDCGNGYSEEDSFFIQNAYVSKREVAFELPVAGNVKMLRIDPAMDPCVCKIRELTLNGEPIPYRKHGVIVVNGEIMLTAQKKGEKTLSFVFPTEDPNINIALHKLKMQENNHLTVKLEVAKLSMEMAQDMAQAVKRIL